MISRRESVLIGRVAPTGHAVAFVEWEEEAALALQPSAHLNGFGVQGEVYDCALVRIKQDFLGVAIVLVLLDGMSCALTGEVVLELHRHNRNPVEE